MMFARLVRRFLADRKANVAMIFAFAAVPLTFGVGVGVDYSYAASRRVQLDSAADAAVLSAVTPAMMAQSTSAAQTQAVAVFNAQAGTVSGVSGATPTVTVAISGALRTVTLTYTAASADAFSALLGKPTITLSGNAQATAGLAPNIDFYLLLDDSPSMAIAATNAGITTMVNDTSNQGGCGFACHQSQPLSSSNVNGLTAAQKAQWTALGADNYALARVLGVTLRIDLLAQATQNLMDTASAAEVSNRAAYRMAITTFDSGFQSIQPLTASLSTAKTSAGTVALEEVYSNGNLTQTNANNDTDTNYDLGMQGVNNLMPNPGSGTGTPGDTPQEVLFLVTDGVEDENVSGSRQQSLMDNGWCTTIKNRGIRIAVLYTTYLPLPTNSWYNTYIDPFQSKISQNMQSCASPGLFYEVQTGGDISAALASLFQLAVQSAYLSK